MGQKTNPTALRLEKTNQHFKSCWYSHYYYSDQLHNNFKIRDYITKIFNRMHRCPPFVYIKNSFQSHKIWCFFLKKRIRRFKYKRVKAEARKSPIFSKKWSAFYGATLRKKITDKIISTQKNHGKMNFAVPRPMAQPQNKIINHGSPIFYRVKLSTLVLGIFHKQSSILLRGKKRNLSPMAAGGARGSLPSGHSFHARNLMSTKVRHKTRIENAIYLSNFSQPSFIDGKYPSITNDREYSQILNFSPIFPTQWPTNASLGSVHPLVREKGLSVDDSVLAPMMVANKSKKNNLPTQENFQKSRKKVELHPVKVSQVQQNADFLAENIISALKKRVTYNRLRRQILRDVVKSPFVKGIRVTLSGRVESKSKKAQKARTNTFHWGQTELHVFSSLVQFTNNHCITPFGKIGIKIWVCYHN